MALKISFRFSIAEYADMNFLNSVCSGNDLYGVPEYQRRFPNSQISTRREAGTFPSVRVTVELEVNQYVDEKKNSDRLPFMSVNERNYLQRDSSKATRTALSQFGRLTPHWEESAEGATYVLHNRAAKWFRHRPVQIDP